MRNARVVLGSGTTLLAALLAIALMVADDATAQTPETPTPIATPTYTSIGTYDAGDRVSYTFPSLSVAPETNVSTWDIVDYYSDQGSLATGVVGAGRSTERITCEDREYTLYGGDSFFDSFNFNPRTRRLTGTLKETLGTGLYGFALSLDGTRKVSYTDVLDYDQTKVIHEDVTITVSYTGGTCGTNAYYEITVNDVDEGAHDPLAGLTPAELDAYCQEGRVGEPHWHYDAVTGGCHSHPPSPTPTSRDTAQPLSEKQRFAEPLTSQEQKESPPPAPNGLTAREQAIVDAMRTYTGNLKADGLPWMRPLRAHAGIPDISSSERKRLWSIAQGE